MRAAFWSLDRSGVVLGVAGVLAGDGDRPAEGDRRCPGQSRHRLHDLPAVQRRQAERGQEMDRRLSHRPPGIRRQPGEREPPDDLAGLFPRVLEVHRAGQGRVSLGPHRQGAGDRGLARPDAAAADRSLRDRGRTTTCPTGTGRWSAKRRVCRRNGGRIRKTRATSSISATWSRTSGPGTTGILCWRASICPSWGPGAKGPGRRN